jgi:hypothetical protein
METQEKKLTPCYTRKCKNCGQKPTVSVPEEGRYWDLCGPCCFGESDCIDPKNW